MRPGTLIVILAALLPAAAPAELKTLVIEGQLDDGQGGERGASVHVVCEPDPNGGAVSMELWVPQAAAKRDFDYDDFEGPDAAARDAELSHVSAHPGNGATEIRAAAAGWYSGEAPDTFVFGVSQRSHQPGKLATFLGALDAKQKSLVWTQTGFDDAKRQLHATFQLDQATSGRIHATADACLTKPARPKPHAKKD